MIFLAKLAVIVCVITILAFIGDLELMLFFSILMIFPMAILIYKKLEMWK